MINVHESITKEDKPTIEEIDTTRVSNKAYRYLCHLEECRVWIESMISKKYKSLKHFEAELPKGIDLCHLALVYAPETIKKIYYGKKPKQEDCEDISLLTDYKFTDNIFFFISSLRTINLPEVFIFDTVSLYERKNIPSVIFCLHGLSHYLKYKGYTTKTINSVFGMEFSKALIDEKDEELKNKEIEGVSIPEFSAIKSVMHKEAINDILLRIKYQVYKNTTQYNLVADSENKNGVTFVSKEEDNTFADNIKNKLTKIRVLDYLVDGLRKQSSSKVNAILKSYLHKKCYKEIYNKKDVSVYAIKFFHFVFYENINEHEKERKIQELQELCHKEKERNYKIEEYLETLDVRCNLLTNNKVNVSNISVVKPKLEDVISHKHQYEIEEHSQIFYLLQNEPIFLIYLLTKVQDYKTFIVQYVMVFFDSKKADEIHLIRYTQQCFKFLQTNNNKNMYQTQNDSLIYSKTMQNSSFEKAANAHLCNNKLFDTLKILVSLFYKSGNAKLKNDIAQIIKNLEKVELQNDPSKICMDIFNQEKPRDEALENETIRKIYITRLKTLRAVILSVFNVFEKNISDLPFYLHIFMKETYIVTKNVDMCISIFYDNFVYPILIAFDVYNNIKVSEELREKSKIVHSALECIIKEKKVRLFEPLSKFFNEGKEKMREIFNTMIKSEREYSEYESFERAQVCLTAINTNNFIRTIKDLMHNKNKKNEGNNEVDDGIFVSLQSSQFYNDFITSLKNIKELPNIHKPILFYIDKPILKEITVDRNEERIRNIKMRVVELLRIANGRNLLDLIVRQSSEDEERRYRRTIKDIINKYGKKNQNSKNTNIVNNTDSSATNNLENNNLDSSNISSSINFNSSVNNNTNTSFSSYVTKNYYCKNTSEFLSIFMTKNKLIKTLSSFKDSIFDDLLILDELKISLKANFFSEILVFLAEDILKIKFMANQRNKSLKMHTKNYEALKNKGNYLEKQMKDYENYLMSFSRFMIKKKVKNIKGKECEYGSFSISGSDLLKKNILICMLCVDHSKKVIKYKNECAKVKDKNNIENQNVSESSDSDCECHVCNNPNESSAYLQTMYKPNNEIIPDLDFVFMSNEPGVIVVEIFMKGEMIYKEFSFRFDVILECKRKNENEFKIDEICIFNVKELVNLINNKFIA